MRSFGFSTGALAKGNFQAALALSDQIAPRAIEYSALRTAELWPLAGYLTEKGAGDYEHIALHAPSKYSASEETSIVACLKEVSRHIPGLRIIAHPDAIVDFGLWRSLGSNLCVENMDHRKPGGRDVEELHQVFGQLPNAQLCFDIGHAHEVDRSMSVGYQILQHFGKRIVHVHASEVTDDCAHKAFSASCEFAFAKVASMIPEDAPIILEVVVAATQLRSQLEVAKNLFAIPMRDAGASFSSPAFP